MHNFQLGPAPIIISVVLCGQRKTYALTDRRFNGTAKCLATSARTRPGVRAAPQEDQYVIPKELPTQTMVAPSSGY
ncbi:hypothetical protein TELCIR_00652 [Teladorsagia circumcincta]|uniref:Uncharacterized protein n=1 Tax=Teladorsagia circumcincta TaxID=45464 RepID=A0A2G9V5K9_TELCI|nr:hypothetical protein TELCIR_00652 [Teladorsagia circumcincta]